MRELAKRVMAAILLAAASLFGAGGAFANDAWLYFRGDRAYEAERRAEILEGRVPSFSFPRFEVEGTLSGGADDTLGVSLSTPTFWYDSPAASAAEFVSTDSSAESPKLPELQRFLAGLPYPAQVWLGLEAGRAVSARFDFELTYRRDVFYDTGSTASWDMDDWFLGLLGDMEFPRRSWVAYAAPGYGFAAGRFPSGFGEGKFGSTILNPNALWYDQARLHIGDDRLRFVWMLGTSSTLLSEKESDIQFRLDADGTSYWDRINDQDNSEGRSDAVKLFSYHLLEWRPLERLRLGIAEMGVVGGTDPQLAFLLPTLCWHNAYAPGSSNVAMAGLVSAVPVRGLELSGEFLVDDVRAWDDPANGKPNSFAWQAQASYDFDPEPGSSLSFGAAFTHVDRWTYVRWQPYLAMYQRQVLPGGSVGIDVPLGFDYGPDVDHFGAWAGIGTARGAKAELRYELVYKGPIRFGMIRLVDNIKTDDTTPEYIPVYYDYDDYAGSGALAAILAKPDEIRNIVSLSGALPLGGGFEAVAAVSLGFYRNYGNQAGESERLVLVYAGMKWSGGISPR